MERVLLWLDELDDLCAIWAHSPERIRHRSLHAGLLAALASALLAQAAISVNVFTVLASTALATASLLVWTAAAGAELAGRRP